MPNDDNGKILQLGLDIIERLLNDDRFSFSEEDLKIYTDGLSSDDEEISSFILNTNARYSNSTDTELHGNFLNCDCASKDDIKAQVRFNLDDYYEMYQESNDFDKILDEITDSLLKVKHDPELMDSVGSKDYASLRPKLIIRMLNFSDNYAALESSIYRRIGDMAMCAYFVVRDNGGEYFLSAKVPKETLDTAGISADKLLDDAAENASVLYPARLLFSMEELFDPDKNWASIDEALDLVKRGERQVPKCMVVTNSKSLNGASAVFYPGVLEKLAELIGGDFYLSFMSIHSVAVHPVNAFKLSVIRENLCSTNSYFNDGDTLSYNIFKYEVRKKRLKKV